MIGVLLIEDNGGGQLTLKIVYAWEQTYQMAQAQTHHEC